MKLPRDLDGQGLARTLRPVAYEVIQQNGSRMRVATEQDRELRITIPRDVDCQTPIRRN